RDGPHASDPRAPRGDRPPGVRRPALRPAGRPRSRPAVPPRTPACVYASDHRRSGRRVVSAARRPLARVGTGARVKTYAGFRRHWEPAREGAQHDAIDEFVEIRLASYADNRDCPGREATSRLSPLIASGAITIEDCSAAALAARP